MLAAMPTLPRSGPPTGAEYLRSLDDGRAVIIEGERVRNVAEHVAFRRTARSFARLYDVLAEGQPELAVETDTGSGTLTHRFFRVCRSREALLAARDAIAGWARLSYGHFGRSPDYKAAFTTTLGANPDFYGPFRENAIRWYQSAQERVPFLAHALVNPPVDRHLPPSAIKDVCVHVIREGDAGIWVSGAKVVATAAVFTEYTLIGQTPNSASDDPTMALMFAVPTRAEGLKLLCRPSYEAMAARSSSPADHPLSSRFDENDAIVVLDDVFVPWEDVFLYRDPARCRSFFQDSGYLANFLFHGCTRVAVKLDFFAGLLSRALALTGGDASRTNLAILGEVVAMSHTAWSLSTAMAADPDPWVGDAVSPNRRAAIAWSVLAPDMTTRLRDLVERAVGSGLIYVPSSVHDLDHPEAGAALRRYVRGSHGGSARERIQLVKLLWDALGSEFGGRGFLYERSWAGGYEGCRLQAVAEAERCGRLAGMEALVDRCLGEIADDEPAPEVAAW